LNKNIKQELNTYAVIVTYANRFHLLGQVIDSCFLEGVDKVIVIDNNSEQESRTQLENLESRISDKLKVVYLDKNIGSAGGYKKGLEEAYNDVDCEYIWLLDDDNQPQKDSLDALKDFWHSLQQEDKKDKVSLLSYRKDRIAFKEAIMTNNPDLVLGRKNSFLGFHIMDLPKKVIKVLKRKLNIQTFKENENVKSGLVSLAPYGGMFFHKNIIKTIGYPNEDFFVYADDHDWSYRITKNGGFIYLVLNSLVDDIDTSWNLKEKTISPFYSFLNQGSDFRVYYSVRNRVFFEKNLIQNKWIYNSQLQLFIFFLSFYKNTKNKKRYEVFKNAIDDGLNNKLGKIIIKEKDYR